MASTLFLQACGSSLLQQQDNDAAGTSDIGRTGANRQYEITVPGRVPPDTTAHHPAAGETAARLPAHVWSYLADRFSFALEHDNEAIDRQIERYLRYDNHLYEVTERAAPFIHEIARRIEERGMPAELALLPIVESGYDPAAVSGQYAAGLWQFMGPTADSLGLKRDWWYDGRYDPLASTDAALDYLTGLHAEFDGDWLLALAGYNAGRGTVGRAIRRNERRSLPTDFWSLNLPGETESHIPRLLALSRIIADPDRYGIALYTVPFEPVLATVDAGSQIDLRLAAELAGLEHDLLRRLNPGYRQWATHPDGPHTLLLPAEHAEPFTQALAALGDGDRIIWDNYVIRPGDTLGAIAQRFNTRVDILRTANGLRGSLIVAGDNLRIPRGSSPLAGRGLSAAQGDAVSYTVRRGDSLWEIATRHQLSVEELLRWNGLGEEDLIHPGQELKLRPETL